MKAPCDTNQTEFVIQAAYLDYVNNFLTVGNFADHYGMSEREAHLLIDLGRIIHERLTF